MIYAIKGLCHRTDIDMGRHGFSIDLSPCVPELVRLSGLNQEQIDRQIQTMGATWLDAAGFDGMFDPDNCGFEADQSAPLGPGARRLYEPHMALRVTWGAWGPEHISVPGNACGLDIDHKSFGCVFRGGASLHPHNLDSLQQKYLLLILFAEIAYNVTLLSHNPGWTLKDVPELPR